LILLQYMYISYGEERGFLAALLVGMVLAMLLIAELAFHCDRVANGITSVDTASREDAHVRLLRDRKGWLGT
jgi:hypothetical protein